VQREQEGTALSHLVFALAQMVQAIALLEDILEYGLGLVCLANAAWEERPDGADSG